MRHIHGGTFVVLSSFLVSQVLCGSLGAAQEDSIGTVHFPVSCSPPAQATFERSVALLHHMTYDRAREGFEAVAAQDPDCAMAQWGIAMSLFQPLWPNRPTLDELRRGREAVERAMFLRPGTERERLFLDAVSEFFNEEETGDYWQRIRRWERGQEALHDAYPDDLEAAAFFALSHLATAPLAPRPLDHHARAAEILLAILGAEPNHPGAVHYLIHANDISGRERESLDTVRRYGEIAPNNTHALHMPTHIFVRLGSWQEVIDWNRKAARAAREHPAGEHGEYISDELPHALEYLVYAALQQGEDSLAEQTWNELRSTQHLQPTFKTAFHLASIPARIALERHDWAGAAMLRAREPEWVDWDRFPWPEAITWFAAGLGSARSGDLGAAGRAAAVIVRLRDKAREGGEESFARQIEILHLELTAWIAHGAGDSAAALDRLRSAVELERATPKPPVTPAPTLPAQELLGDLLLVLGRPEAAREAYELSLASAPGRRNSIQGLALAAGAAGGRKTTEAHQ